MKSHYSCGRMGSLYCRDHEDIQFLVVIRQNSNWRWAWSRRLYVKVVTIWIFQLSMSLTPTLARPNRPGYNASYYFKDKNLSELIIYWRNKVQKKKIQCLMDIKSVSKNKRRKKKRLKKKEEKNDQRTASKSKISIGLELSSRR